jgi:uncharacterized membrane protein
VVRSIGGRSISFDHERSGARARDLDRLLTFADAFVAIAITLFVLPLVDLTSDLTEKRVCRTSAALTSA